MLNWLSRKGKVPGWFAATLDADTMHFVHAQPSPDGKWSVADYGSRRAGEMRLDGFQCTTPLAPDEYQFLLVEAPDVPAAELKSAVRWKVKDLVDYRVDDATIDVLDIPPTGAGAAAARVRPIFAIAAQNDLLQGRIRQLQAARVPLSVIDIRETAQRNIAALYESGERGLAFIHFGPDAGLLTINFRGELYLARRVEVGMEEIIADTGDGGALERAALEIQRTFDHFDRQFRQIAVAKLVIGPTPRPTRLAEVLRGRFDMPVQEADLCEVLDFAAPPDAATQWRLFHHFGAALRQDAGAAR